MKGDEEGSRKNRRIAYPCHGIDIHALFIIQNYKISVYVNNDVKTLIHKPLLSHCFFVIIAWCGLKLDISANTL